MIFYVKDTDPDIDPKMMLANSLVAIDPNTFHRRRLILSAGSISHEAYTDFADFISGCDSAVFVYSDPDNNYKELTLSDERGNASELSILDGELTIIKLDVDPRIEKKVEVVPLPTKESQNLKRAEILKCCSLDKDDCTKLIKRSLIIGGIGCAIFAVASMLSNKRD